MKYLFSFLFVLWLLPISVFAQQSEADILLDENAAQIEALERALEEQVPTLDGLPYPETHSEQVRAEVIDIVSDEVVDGFRQMVFIAAFDNQEVTIDTSKSFVEGLRYDIGVGDDVYLQVLYLDGEVTNVYLVDVVRTQALWLVVVFFAVLILAVGRLRGLMALIGLAITLVVLFAGVLPLILKGWNPVATTIVGSIIILAVNMHTSHGFGRSTFFAYLSTVIGLGLAWIFSSTFVHVARLSGLASEESILLFFHSDQITLPSGILLAGMILGAVGVLDDIAITQTETVAELHEANKTLERAELFKRAMRVGRHHIASTVNTLVLAYVGASLSLFLLYMLTQGISVSQFLNEEPVAEEIIRTLAGTAALVLTVPISTWFAVWHKKR